MENFFMEENFKSPIGKLNKFFKRSRDAWKERAKKGIQEIRVYKKRILFLESSKALLKDEIKQLKQKNKLFEGNSKKKQPLIMK